MAPRRRSTKRNKKGGFFNRIQSIYNNTKVQTFCCENKTSGSQLGTTTSNKGTNCDPSDSGQCNVATGKTYKFRCFDIKKKMDENGNEIVGRDVIDEAKNDEQCKYVAGVVGKVGSTVGNVGSTVGTAIKNSGNFASNISLFGGKKSKRRKSNKNRRTNKRK